MVTPGDFLTFAEKAHAGAQGEYDHRNAAGRAYYAAFHCCDIESSRCPPLTEPGKLGSHDRVYQQIHNLVGNGAEAFALKSMASVAKSMKTVRQRADYQIEGEFDGSDATQQISLARKVMAKWAKINADFPKQP